MILWLILHSHAFSPPIQMTTYLFMYEGKSIHTGRLPYLRKFSHKRVLDLDLKLMNHLLWRRLSHWAQTTCYLPQSLHNLADKENLFFITELCVCKGIVGLTNFTLASMKAITIPGCTAGLEGRLYGILQRSNEVVGV